MAHATAPPASGHAKVLQLPTGGACQRASMPATPSTHCSYYCCGALPDANFHIVCRQIQSLQ
eukprot:365224-Chlamydomonas_euryale.AAC.9